MINDSDNVGIVEFDYRNIFHWGQLQVWNNFLWNGINILPAGRRFGKSALASYIILISALRFANSDYWWVTPKYKHGAKPFENLKRLAIVTTNGSCEINKTDRKITFTNGSSITFHSADNPDDLRSQGLRGLVLDEAAKIPASAWEDSLMASLTDYADSWCLMISTPKGRDWFWKLFEDGKIEKNGIRSHLKADGTCFKSIDNPYADKKKIALDKLVMSERTYAQEHDCIFLTNSGAIFEREYFNHRIDPDKFIPIMRFISADTAATSNPKSAYNCFVVGEFDAQLRLYIREVIRFKATYVQLEEKIKEVINKYNKDGLLQGIILEFASTGIPLYYSLMATLPEDMAQLLIRFYPQQSKEDRAREASVFMEKGKIFFPFYDDGIEWLVPFEEELLAAPPPSEGYMDQVDAFSNLCKVVYIYLVDGLKNSKPKNEEVR